jgi:hypothetical protein
MLEEEGEAKTAVYEHKCLCTDLTSDQTQIALNESLAARPPGPRSIKAMIHYELDHT